MIKKIMIALMLISSSVNAQTTLCPPIVGIKSSKEYYTSRKIVCFKNASAAKKAGYGITPPTPPIVQASYAFSGSNNLVTSSFAIYKPTRVTYLYTGTRNFSVVSYFSTGKYGGLLANHIGTTSGQSVISEAGTYYLEIEGEGNWEVRLDPL